MSDERRTAIGIDVGGSGIKAATIDLATGELVSDRLRVVTPTPSNPPNVIASIARLVKRLSKIAGEADAPVGITMPSVVIDGIGFHADASLAQAVGRHVRVINDADAAGIAEVRFGAARGRRDTVILLTLGTGVGSAIFTEGVLVPNTELGHMEIRGRDAERRSAAAARLRRGLSWRAWAADLDEHMHAIERLFSPGLFIIGGGVSKNGDKFLPRLTVDAQVVPATLRNDAGIIGAALVAAGLARDPAIEAEVGAAAG
jgi:polyphosphate glucokinase